MLRDLFETSGIIFVLKCICRCYRKIKQKLVEIYHNSQINRLTKRGGEKTKICFRYSFFNRIAETKLINSANLDNSRLMQYLIRFYRGWKDRIIYYLRTSLTIALAKDTKEKLYFSPVRIMGMIIVIAIAVNVALSFIFQRQISLWGWLVRGLFLFIAVTGLFYKADWPAVKRGTVFLRKVWRE